MTVERLNDLYYIKKHIERIDYELLHLAEQAAPAGLKSSDMSGLPKSPSPINKSDEIMKKICELNSEKAELLIELEEIESWIRSQRRRDRLIIKCRYEDRMSWQQIADKIGGGNTIDSVKSAHYRCLNGYS